VGTIVPQQIVGDDVLWDMTGGVRYGSLLADFRQQSGGTFCKIFTNQNITLVYLFIISSMHHCVTILSLGD